MSETPKVSQDNIPYFWQDAERKLAELRSRIEFANRVLSKRLSLESIDVKQQERATETLNSLAILTTEADSAWDAAQANRRNLRMWAQATTASTDLKILLTEIGQRYPSLYD